MKNSFKELTILPVYDSNDDIEQFYNDVLSRSAEYYRASGYFSHKLLKHISKGLLGLLKNKGIFNLIISHQIDEETYQKILEGYKNKADSSITKKIHETTKEDLSDLAFLISLGLINIKVAYSPGVYHEKYGLVIDKDGNKILFSGSNNETQAALKANFESFETTLSWDCSTRDIEKIDIREKSFNGTWLNQNEKLIVYDAPEALYKGVMENLDTVKTLKKITVKTAYIDLFDRLEIVFNYEADFSKWFMFKRWKPFIESFDNNVLKFNIKLTFKDSMSIIRLFKEFLTKSDVNVLLTDRTNKTIERNVIDFDEVKKEGYRVKADSYFTSNRFLDFKEEINNMLKRDLRDAQVMATDHIISVQRSMNFSVPGSGKTATVLAAFQYLKEHKKIDKLLVIGPKNCFKSWKDEAKTVLGMQMNKILELNTVSDYAGKRIQLEYNYDQSDIILLNFAGTLNASSLLQQYIDDKVLVVFDEIHRLKKLDGTIFKATYPIVETTKYRVALTGTPLPNGYIDLYNQFLLLFGDYTRTFFGFVSYRLSEKDKIFITEGKTSAEVSLKMSPFFVRLSKEDLKVPKPNDDHVKRVEENSSKINKYLRSGSGSSIGSLFNYLKIGVIPENINPDDKANDMDLEEYEEKNNQRYFDVNVRTEKINLFLSLIDEIIGREESVVVWFNFIASMKKIFEIVSNERNYSIAMIYGATPGETREKIIDEFNEGKIKILLTNPHTLAESVSLHKKCNNAIYMEMNYNLSQYLQSRDRIHRLGIEPNRETNYYILLTKYNGYSIDEKIYKALHKKEFRMYDTIEGQMQINRDEKSIKEKLVEEIKR